jgi:hypothetical protein
MQRMPTDRPIARISRGLSAYLILPVAATSRSWAASDPFNPADPL